MNKTFEDLFNETVGFGFAKQLAFADVLGERNWGVDITKGQAKFGDDLVYPIQLLGTESDGDGTWLWTWANDKSNIPPNMLRSCLELRDFGEENDIAQLTEANFSTDIASGHMLSIIASGLNPSACYYRGPYDGGALYFLVENVEQVCLPIEPQRVLSTITQVISNFDVNHRRMVHSFLSGMGYEVSNGERELVAVSCDSQISIKFDELARICDINGTLSAKQPPEKKERNWKFWQKNG